MAEGLGEDEKGKIEKVETLLGDRRVTLNPLLFSEGCLCMMLPASRHAFRSPPAFLLVYLQLSEVLVQKEKLKTEGFIEPLSPVSEVFPAQKAVPFRSFWEGEEARPHTHSHAQCGPGRAAPSRPASPFFVAGDQLGECWRPAQSQLNAVTKSL